MPELTYQSVPFFEIKALAGEEPVDDPSVVRSIYNVHGIIDDYLDVVHNGAWKKTIKERLDRVKLLWQHDAMSPPIGAVLKLKEIGKADLPDQLLQKYPDATGALYGEVKFFDTPRGSEVLTGIRGGAITENSIGFSPKDFKYEEDPATEMVLRHINQAQLWDISPVNWGANPATMNVRAALPFVATEKADEGMSWDGPAQMKMCENKSDLRAICAWVDPEGDPESKSSYKLPHHMVDGRKVVWKGVSSAMGALMGSMGGVDIPDGDRKGVYNHLSKHYAQFDKEPPAFKWVNLAESVLALRRMSAEELARFTTELRDGVPAGEDIVQKLTEMLQAFNALLVTEAEPSETAVVDTESEALKSAARRRAELASLTLNTEIEIRKRRLLAANGSPVTIP